LGGRAKASFLKERAGKAIMNLAFAMISILRNGVSPEPETNRPPDARRLLLGAAYNRALLGYVERPYRGRVTLLWPEELALDDHVDPTAGWSEAASDVDIHPVPGGHITCLTSNVGSLASTLKVCLERAQAGDARSTMPRYSGRQM
jgi:thioesterase domain-containing protein